MATSIMWPTGLIFVPRADMPIVQVSPEIREFDVAQFHLDLRTLHASTLGAPHSRTHNHNTIATIVGVTYARLVEVIAPYTLEFEDGQYTVICYGANHNLAEVAIENQVRMVTNNSAGLIDRASALGQIG